MITASDSHSTIDLGDYYAILPSDGWVQKVQESGKCIAHVKPGFAYNSGSNPDFLSIDQIHLIEPCRFFISTSVSDAFICLYLVMIPYPANDSENDIAAVVDILRSHI